MKEECLSVFQTVVKLLLTDDIQWFSSDSLFHLMVFSPIYFGWINSIIIIIVSARSLDAGEDPPEVTWFLLTHWWDEMMQVDMISANNGVSKQFKTAFQPEQTKRWSQLSSLSSPSSWEMFQAPRCVRRGRSGTSSGRDVKTSLRPTRTLTSRLWSRSTKPPC